MSINNIEIQDHLGNSYYPKTKSTIVMMNDGSTLENKMFNHGNHIPAPQTANSKVFLRNDNTWQSLPNGSTSASGIVQLNDATNSTSTSQAATANAVKKAYDLAASKAASNHTHNYLSEVPSKITKALTFEANSEIQRVQPATADGACYYAFYKNKTNRSGYFGYESSENNNFVIKNEVNNARLDFKTTGTTSEIGLNNLTIANNGNTIANVSSMIIRADNDAVSANEYLSLKSGHNELKIISSGGGATVTKGQDKLLFNDNIVYHAGNKPSATELGVVPTSDYTLYTITKNLQVTTSWMDTGIVGNNLPSGSYIVQISGMTSEATNTWYEIWTGTMSWYNGTTNSTLSDEILLHNTGHASNEVKLYLRTIRSAGGGYVKLQIASSRAFTKATNVTFKFRKLI